MAETRISIFKGNNIRKIVYKNEWWFSVVDVCYVLTESIDSGAYWRKLKQRLKEEGSKVVTFCHGLKLEAQDGKSTRLTVLILKAFSELSKQSPPLKLNH